MQNGSPSLHPSLSLSPSVFFFFFLFLKKEIAILLVDSFERDEEGRSELGWTRVALCDGDKSGFKGCQAGGSLDGFFLHISKGFVSDFQMGLRPWNCSMTKLCGPCHSSSLVYFSCASFTEVN